MLSSKCLLKNTDEFLFPSLNGIRHGNCLPLSAGTLVGFVPSHLMPPTIGSLPALRIEPLRFAQTHGTDCFYLITVPFQTIQIWDLAKCCIGAEGGLKLTLTGHINAIRGLAVSPRHPYLFSAGEDKMVKCK